MANLMAQLAALGTRPAGSRVGHEVGVWWRLSYYGGRYVTEEFNHSSICLAPPGALSLQLVTSVHTEAGMGVIEVPLGPGERPVFYRVRSMDLDQVVPGSSCDGIVYGRASEGPDRVDSELWCLIPGQPGYEHPVPRQWLDHEMIELQAAHYG